MSRTVFLVGDVWKLPKPKTIRPSEKDNKLKVYIVYTNEFLCSVTKIFKNKKDAKQFIKNGKGLYMDIIDEFELE